MSGSILTWRHWHAPGVFRHLWHHETNNHHIIIIIISSSSSITIVVIITIVIIIIIIIINIIINIFINIFINIIMLTGAFISIFPNQLKTPQASTRLSLLPMGAILNEQIITQLLTFTVQKYIYPPVGNVHAGSFCDSVIHQTLKWVQDL